MGHRPLEILCVDDDPDSLTLRATFLKTIGYAVQTAANGADGLELLRSRTVDAVVMDYQMPGMNGGEAARRMKALRPEVPVVLVSALPELPADAPREAIDLFVSKNEPLALLVAALQRVLSAHHMTAERSGSAPEDFVQRLADFVRPRRRAKCATNA